MADSDQSSQAFTSRREFLSGGVLLASSMLVTPTLANELWTPPQTEGPFFPESTAGESDADMTRLSGSKRRPKGEEVLILGTVRDLGGKPLEGVGVEVWQACASGRYHHRRDRNPAALDPDFQYYCSLKTSRDGQYRFRTIRPGSYPAAVGWDRPSHIHFKVRAKGYPELVTQMYFEDDPLNAKDGILLGIPKKQRKLVLVEFQAIDKVKTGRFDIILNRSGKHAHLTTPILP